MELKLKNNSNLELSSEVISTMHPALLKASTLYHENCPNIDGWALLNAIYNWNINNQTEILDRIRVDIGNVEGSLSELLKFKNFRGLNDNYEPQEKPRLVGTWTINNWYTTEKLAETQAAFDGLTIVGDPNYLIDFNDLAVQVLDDTKPNYNPAVAIILNNNGLGTLLPEPIVDGQEGRWFMTKAQAQLINLGSNYWFKGCTNVSDTLKIVAASTQYYTFNSFNEFRFFTSTTTIGSNSTNNCNFNGCTLLRYLTTNGNIVEFLANTNSSKSNNNQVFYFKESVAPETAMCYVSGNDYTYFFDVRYTNNRYILSGSYSKYLGLSFKENWFNIITNIAIQQQFRTYYEYAAPQLSYDSTNVTITVERESTIYYTTDGTTPTVNSTEYTEPFAWDGTGVIKAMAIETIDNVDDIVYADNFYAQTAIYPGITYHPDNQTIMFLSEPGSTIYYTLDGTCPTLESSTYSGPIDVSELGDIVKVRCFARVSGKNDSEITSKLLVLDETLWGTDGDTSYFAVQCMDSTKPNYNPAVCIILDNNGKLTDKLIGGCGGYLSKSAAALITGSINWFSDKTTVSKANLLAGTFTFSSFTELKYFTGITALPRFSNCTSLTSLTIPENVVTLNNSCLYNTGISGTFTIPSQITTLGRAFGGSDNSPCRITEFVFAGNNLTTIEDRAFFGVRSINSPLEIPEGVTTLTGMPIYHTHSPKPIVFPSTITTLERSLGWNGGGWVPTYSYCRIKATNPPTFMGMSGTYKIYIGDGSSAEHDDAILQAYLADSNWATYSSRLDTWYNYLHPTT